MSEEVKSDDARYMGIYPHSENGYYSHMEVFQVLDLDNSADDEGIEDYYNWCDQFPSMNINNFITWLEKVKEMIPPEYRDSAFLILDRYDDDVVECTDLRVEYLIPESDEQQAYRLEKRAEIDKANKSREEEKDFAELKRLREKYPNA